MIEAVGITPFHSGHATMDEVADFYLDVQRAVEAAGQKIFVDIWAGWRELKRLDEGYQVPGNFWVAEDTQNQLVGCVGLKDEGNRQGLIGRFGVDVAFQRQGIGRRLMQAALGHAEANDFKTLTLETSPKQHGMPLYEELGFVTIGHAADDGDNIMELQL